MTTARCCICMEDLTPASSSNDTFIPSCCPAGQMHLTCGKTYVKCLRLQASETHESTEARCPTCRRIYTNPRDLTRLLPDRRLLKYEATFHPLDDHSSIEISIRENHGGIHRQILEYQLGQANQLPRRPFTPPRSEQITIPWPFYPSIDIEKEEPQQQQQQQQNSSSSSSTTTSADSPPPTEIEETPTRPPPPPQEHPTLTLATQFLREEYAASESLYALLHTSRRLIETDPLRSITPRQRRLRKRKLKKMNEYIVEALKQMNPINDVFHDMVTVDKYF